MRNKKTIISLAVGSAFAAIVGAVSSVSATESPFAAQPLDKGYVLAYADRVDPNKYGGGGAPKTSEGRCGMSMVDANKDGTISKDEIKGKMTDGKCGSGK